MDVSIIGEESYIDNKAIQQVYNVCKRYPGVIKAVAMPDLHPGSGYPIGCAFKTCGVCLPRVIGGDIGCGMTLFELEKVSAYRIRPKKISKKLAGLDLRQSYEGASKLLTENGLPTTDFDHQLGSIGGGNHFCEIRSYLNKS